MTEFACKKTENSTNSTTDKNSIEKIISQIGGSITLDSVASVEFLQETFSNDVKVKLSKTESQEIREDMQIASILNDIKAVLNYEIRINTKQLPDKIVKVTIDVPDSLISKVSGDYGLGAYGKFDFSDSIESLQTFTVLDTKFYGSRKKIEVELSPLYFSDKWTSDQSFEAIITIGISLGKNLSVGRITNADEVMEDCCDAKKLTCPLNVCVIRKRGFSEIPVEWPLDRSKKKPHLGVDYVAATGDPVYPAAEGTVLKVTAEKNKVTGELKGWGNYILIRHKTPTCDYITLYGHLSKQLVSEGQVVSRSDKIGEVGQTGGADGPHLHFEYRLLSPIPRRPQTVYIKMYARDPLPCTVLYSKVRIQIPVCASGCLGFVGIGKPYGYRLYSIYDLTKTDTLINTTIPVTERLQNFPPCATPTPDLLELRLPAGIYIAELTYDNKVYTDFFGASFQVVPNLNECQYVFIY